MPAIPNRDFEVYLSETVIGNSNFKVIFISKDCVLWALQTSGTLNDIAQQYLQKYVPLDDRLSIIIDFVNGSDSTLTVGDFSLLLATQITIQKKVNLNSIDLLSQ
jgi:hypothetical protein